MGSSSLSTKEKIEITDCKVLKNAKGKSRKVAFVGFRQESQATFVVESFHRTFMGMSRLTVELALTKKDEELDPKKVATVSNTESTKTKTVASQEKLSKHKEEILKLAGSGQKSKFWANDINDPMVADGTVDKSQMNEPIRDNAEADDSDSDSDSSSDEERDMEEEANEIPHGPSTALSDLDFLRSKQKAADDLEDEDDTISVTSKQKKIREEQTGTVSLASVEHDSSSDSDDSSSDDDSDPKKVEAIDANITIASNAAPSESNNHTEDMHDEVESAKKEETAKSRLFVRNLPFETTEEELEEYFSVHGALVECHIPVDDQKRNKGFAFVQYASAVDALEARKQLDKSDFQGRLLHILPARPAPAASQSGGNENLTWKQSKEQARKDQDIKSGGDAAKGWSATFVRGDAVVDNLADRLGLRKADFLGVKDKLSSGDAAVRLALGETQIIEENREYFRQNGVDMEALVNGRDEENSATRSKTSILVKNLPYDTRVEELNKLFQMGDESLKILLPPSRTIALVEYGHPSDAKKAFRKLAYRRFKHVPIYLEWAPLACKLKGEKDVAESSLSSQQQNMKEPISETTAEEAESDVVEGAVSTIYVKNLNFGTTEEAVRQVFEKNVGPVRSVRIPQKVAPVKSGEEPQLLSMGYGFVELESETSVRKAIQVLQGKLVEGHAWEVTISSNKKGGPGQKSAVLLSGINPTKLIVRNVPFQATRTELLKLFGSFGQLRRVRLPKKFDGSHRGFAFIEFLTSKEAVAAMKALSRTHLYGRHLVLEWATEDDQDVNKLRDKAKRDTDGVAVPRNKKIRFT